MISPVFKIQEFLDVVVDKSYQEILLLAEEEVSEAEARSSRVKGAVVARIQGSGQYADLLKKFLFFMRYGIKPDGISSDDYALFRPICERLVAKGRFKSSVLGLFNE